MAHLERGTFRNRFRLDGRDVRTRLAGVGAAATDWPDGPREGGRAAQDGREGAGSGTGSGSASAVGAWCLSRLARVSADGYRGGGCAGERRARFRGRGGHDGGRHDGHCSRRQAAGHGHSLAVHDHGHSSRRVAVLVAGLGLRGPAGLVPALPRRRSQRRPRERHRLRSARRRRLRLLQR